MDLLVRKPRSQIAFDSGYNLYVYRGIPTRIFCGDFDDNPIIQIYVVLMLQAIYEYLESKNTQRKIQPTFATCIIGQPNRISRS